MLQTMLNLRKQPRAFTLVELIVVMVIIAIAAAMIVPSLRGFAIGRASDSAATQIVAMAQYCRVQATGEGRTYRLNFDPHNREVWITSLNSDTATYLAPNSAFGNRFSLPDGMNMTVDIIPQPSTQLVIPESAQQDTASPTAAYGHAVAVDTNQDIELVHNNSDGTYIEFQTSGRTDPAYVQLTDKLGKVINLGIGSSTESMHVLKAEEMR